jgi:hypothetical protein
MCVWRLLANATFLGIPKVDDNGFCDLERAKSAKNAARNGKSELGFC